MKRVLVVASICLLAGCMTTPEELAAGEPDLTLLTQKSVDEYSSCLHTAWANEGPAFLVNVPHGKRVFVRYELAVAGVVDVQATDSGAKVNLYHESKTYAKFMRGLKECV